jgi:hypothetical protein
MKDFRSRRWPASRSQQVWNIFKLLEVSPAGTVTSNGSKPALRREAAALAA